MQMLDGLDDDLDFAMPPPQQRAKSSNPPVRAAPITKKKEVDEDDFDWALGGAGGGLDKKQSEAAPNSAVKKNNASNFGTASFGLGSQKAANKFSSKNDDLDDWGALVEKNDSFENNNFTGGGNNNNNLSNDKNRATGKFGAGLVNKSASQMEGRSSTGSQQYAGFGIMGKKLHAGASSGKKKDDDEDDLLDKVLSRMEESKGIENKQAQEFRQPAPKVKSVAADPWGPQDLDELDEVVETKSKKSAGGGISQELLQRKKNLFGGGGGEGFGKVPKSLGRLNEEEQKEREYFTRDLSQGDRGLGDSGGAQNMHKAYMDFGGRQSNDGSLNREVTQESGIEVLEGVLTRKSNQRRMASGKQQTQHQQMGRPPTGNAQSFNITNVKNDTQFESMDNRLFSADVPDNRNITSPPNFQRPMTGQPAGKPPIQKGMYSQHENEGDILGLLEDSKKREPVTASKAGSGHGNSQDEFNKDMQFRIHDGDEEDEDDDEGGSLYLPTTIAKHEPERAKKMTQKKEKPPPIASTGSQGAGSMILDQPQIHSGGDFNDQRIQLRQQNSAGGGGMKPAGAGSTISQHTPVSQALDEKQMLQKQIDDERLKYSQVQDRYQRELDELRAAHKASLRKEEDRQAAQLHVFNEEKRRLIEEMNKTIELEKEKVGALHKIDVDQREIQWKANLEQMKQLHDDQNDMLKKQLQQKIQMNQLQEEIQKSTGNISSLVQRVSSEQEGQLKQREDQLAQREKALEEKRVRVQERRKHLDQKKKRLQQEMDEIGSREHETKMEFEREKGDLQLDMDRIEADTQQITKELRGKAIEIEVDLKKAKYEHEKLVEQLRNEEKLHQAKDSDLLTLKKALEQEREQMKEEMASNERELKSKIDGMKNKEQEVHSQEREMEMREKALMVELQQASEEQAKLQEAVDSFGIEKARFDEEARLVKEQAERDQIDSEKIGFFKANKDRLRDELNQMKNELEAEKDTLKEDRIKLDLYKNELKTKQKTIESLRYDYIKSHQEKDQEFRQNQNDMRSYTLHEHYTSVSKFYPINPPQFEQKKENLPPNYSRPPQQTSTYVARFNYDEYMRGLKEKLSAQAPLTTGLSGSHFQSYIIKEREVYMKSLHQFNQEQPLLMSLGYAGEDLKGSALEGQEASFNLGSLQHSHLNRDRNVQQTNRTLGNSQYEGGKTSANSLHFISKNLGNTPDQEEADP